MLLNKKLIGGGGEVGLEARYMRLEGRTVGFERTQFGPAGLNSKGGEKTLGYVRGEFRQRLHRGGSIKW